MKGIKRSFGRGYKRKWQKLVCLCSCKGFVGYDVCPRHNPSVAKDYKKKKYYKKNSMTAKEYMGW